MSAGTLHPASTPQTGTSPDTIVQLITAYRGARILTTAVSLGVFDALVEGPCNIEEISKALATEPRATGILLNALTALGFLTKENDYFANTLISRRYLVRNTRGSLAANMRYQEFLAPAWADLPEIVKTGKPKQSLEQLLSKEDFSREYILGMADISNKPAHQLANQLNLSDVRFGLDVGAGPGAYSLALLERQSQLRMLLLDLPSTLKITDQFLAESPLRNRIEFKAGDYHRADFGREAYDLVLFSHVTHDEGEEENRALLRKAFTALRPGGQVIIHDFILDEDKAHPAFPALFSVHMLVYTRRGRIYTIKEYETWLRDAGFSLKDRLDICPEAGNASRAVVAVKL